MCLKLFFKKILPVPKITDYSDYLFITAHASDMAKSSGGTIYKLSQKNKRIKLIVTTDSLSDVKFIDGEDTVEKVEKEEIASAAILGVNEIEFFKFNDGPDIDKSRLREELVKCIAKNKPEVIFIDDINTPNELSLSDRITAEAALEAVEILGSEHLAKKYGLEKHRVKLVAFYNTVKANAFVAVTGALESKLNAIMVHSSLLPQKGDDKFGYYKSYKSLNKLTALYYGLKSGKLYAEGFYVVSGQARHNLPQINF